MAKPGKKTGSKTIANVIAEKVANPDLSLRDIAKGKDISHETVGKILKEEAGPLLTSSDKAMEFLDINLEIINVGARKTLHAMKTMNPSDIREAKEMQSIVDTAFKQNQLL